VRQRGERIRAAAGDWLHRTCVSCGSEGNFAANNAPRTVRANVGGMKVLVLNPLVQQIKSLKSNPNKSISQIQKWIYEGFKINIFVPSTGKSGSLNRKPLY